MSRFSLEARTASRTFGRERTHSEEKAQDVIFRDLLQRKRRIVSEQALHRSWRESRRTTHMPRQMTLMRKARCQCDLRDRELALHKQVLCPFDPPLNDILMQRHAGGFAKECLEVRRADSADRSDAGQRQVFGEMIFDIGQGLFISPPTEAWDPLESTCRHASLSIL